MDRARLLRAAGLVTGILAAVSLIIGRSPGIGPALSVAALVTLLAVGLVAADRTVARPAATGVRTARLTRRRLVDVVPLGPTTGVVVLVVALTGLLSVTSAASTPHLHSDTTPPNPDDGRHFGCLSGGMAQSGPWPGWFYAIPVLTTVAVAIVVAVVALRGVLARPVVESATLSGDSYRRGTASAIVAALGVVVTVPLAGAAYFAYSVLGQPLVCDQPVAQGTRPWLVALVIMAATAGAYYAARLVFPPAAAASPLAAVVSVR